MDKIESTDFHKDGSMDKWESAAPEILSNNYFNLEVLVDAGPRILKLIPAGTNQNLLAYEPQMKWSAPAGEYSLIGGHRLWAAPENPEITYIPENSGGKMELLPDGVRLTREDTFGVHLEKTMEIRVSPDSPKVDVLHRIRNLGAEPLRAAAWAITMLPIGSRARIPLATGELDPHGLQPNRAFVLWPYSQIDDPRCTVLNDTVIVRGESSSEAFKIGVYSPRRWIAAQVKQWLFIKRFNPSAPAMYPDMNCNVECYVRDRFMELETLGPLETLRTGECTEHNETWEIRSGTLDELDADGNPGA